MASGSYKPILKLIQTLDYIKFVGELEKYEKAEVKTPEAKQRAYNEAIFGSLVWSLESNIEQHELVYKYCNWAYHYENLSDEQKSELKKILND